MDVIKSIGAFLLISAIAILSKVFYKKIKIKELVKQILLGLVFGGAAVACNFLLVKDNITFANSIILLSGILFNGPAWIIASLSSAIVRFFTVPEGLEIIKWSSSICLIISGLLGFGIRSFMAEEGKIRWYFGFVISAIVQTVSMLSIFLFNLNDINSVYYLVKEFGFVNLLVNTFAVGIILIIICLCLKQPLLRKEKPIGIQLKIQISLGIAIVIGFSAVAGISYGVLDNSSKETTKSQIIMTFNDLEDNLDTDAGTQMATNYKTFLQSLKMGRIMLHTGEDNVTDYFGELEHYSGLCYLTDATIFRKDGSILASTNDCIASLNSISELNIEQFDTENTGNVILPYQYVEQLGGSYKFLYSRYYSNKDEYHVLVSIDSERFKSCVNTSIGKGVADRHIGENGRVIIVDNEKNILASPIEEISETIDIDLDKKNSLNVVSINDVEYYSYIREFEGYNFVGLLEKEYCDLNMNVSLYITSLSEVLAFFALYAIIFLVIRGSIISPLQRVNASLDTICEGKLNTKVEEYSNRELKVLSEDINATVDALKEYIGKEAKMIQKELAFAKDIQDSVLPSLTEEITSNKHFDIYASMNTAKEVGGDFYDFYLIDDKHLFILIADVSGKGVSAAMFMMQSRTIIRTLIESKIPLEKAIRQANKKLCESNSAQMFVTVWCGILDLETGTLEYVNAGHNKPLVKINNGKFKYLEGNAGFVLAGIDGFNYKSETIQLNKNDEIFLYTDGITEALSVDEKLYGENRLLDLVNNSQISSSKEFCEAVIEDVHEFSKGKEQSDDITMLHVKYIG